MTELLILLALTLLNGALALTETAFVAVRKVRLLQMADEGSAAARKTLLLTQNPTPMLSTIQIGITLIGVLVGAFGGATIAESLANTLRQVPTLAPSADTLAFALVVLFVTYLSVVLGELFPKRLALLNPEAAAVRLVPLLHTVSRLVMPLVRLLTLSTDALLWLVGIPRDAEPLVTEEEVEAMMRQGVQAGIFAETEREMVAGMFSLDELRVAAVMTPRTEIVWLDLDDAAHLNQTKIIEGRFSRLPVARGDLDQVLGLVRAKDLLARALSGQPFDLEAAVRQPLYVPESASAARALEQFKATGQQLALVIDEHGGIAGLVTLMDLTAEIVGDIGPAAAVRRDDSSWLLDGLLPLAEVQELLEIKAFPEEPGAYQTLGGLVMAVLGHIPAAGDSFEWGGWRFEVVDMDGRRVDKVLVQRAAGGVESEADDR